MILIKYYINSDFFEFSLNDLNFYLSNLSAIYYKKCLKNIKIFIFLFWINFSVSGFLFLNKIYKMNVKNIFLPKIF